MGISLKGNDFVDHDSIEELEQADENKEQEDNEKSPLTESNSQQDSQMPGVGKNRQHVSQITQTESSAESPIYDSKFFAVRTTGGQEHVVVNMAQNKINSKKIPVRSILLLDSFKGYIIVEAPDSNIAYEALAGIRHVKGQIRGELPYKDIEGYLVKRPVVTELNIDDTVEVIAGPFKSMKAKITRVDYEKQEATVLLLDSPYQIPVTVDANYLKKISQ